MAILLYAKPTIKEMASGEKNINSIYNNGNINYTSNNGSNMGKKS